MGRRTEEGEEEEGDGRLLAWPDAYYVAVARSHTTAPPPPPRKHSGRSASFPPPPPPTNIVVARAAERTSAPENYFIALPARRPQQPQQKELHSLSPAQIADAAASPVNLDHFVRQISTLYGPLFKPVVQVFNPN